MGEKIYCLKCRTELSDKAKFCPECGKPAPKPEPKEKVFPSIMTVKQAAEFLGISRCFLYKLINQDGLPWVPFGSHKRFIASELTNWAKNRQVVNNQEAG